MDRVRPQLISLLPRPKTRQHLQHAHVPPWPPISEANSEELEGEQELEPSEGDDSSLTPEEILAQLHSGTLDSITFQCHALSHISEANEDGTWPAFYRAIGPFLLRVGRIMLQLRWELTITRRRLDPILNAVLKRDSSYWRQDIDSPR